MPVFGLLKDQFMGTYVIRPSSLIIGKTFGNCGLQSPTSHANGRRRCNVRPFSVRENRDPNVVIAAYGTQVTLHRCQTAKSEWRPREIKDTNQDDHGREIPSPSFDVHIPTENSRRITKNTSTAQVSFDARAVQIQHDSENNTERLNSDVETGERAPNSKESTVVNIFERSISNISLEREKQISPRSSSGSKYTSSNRNNFVTSADKTYKPKQSRSWRQTAWQKRHLKENNRTIPSIANLVDLCEVKDIISKANEHKVIPKNTISLEQYNRKTRFNIIATPPNTNATSDGIKSVNSSATNSVDDSFDREKVPLEDVRKYYADNTLSKTSEDKTSSFSHSHKFGWSKNTRQRCGKNKIEEVWSKRNKIEISSNLLFSHEKLQRPRSAFAILSPHRDAAQKSTTIENNKEIYPASRVKGVRENRPHGIRRRKTCKRHSNSSNNGIFYETCRQGGSPKHLTTEKYPSENLIDPKSLIRQNHRPTTAIRYCRQDRRTVCSITPCLRKAEVAHSAYVTMHDHVPVLCNKTPGSDQQGRHMHQPQSSNARHLSIRATSLGINGQKNEKNEVQKHDLLDMTNIKCEIPTKMCGHREPFLGMNKCNVDKIEESTLGLRSEYLKSEESSSDFSDHEMKGNTVIRRATVVQRNECAPLRLLLAQTQDMSTSTGKHDSKTVKKTNIAEPTTGRIQLLLKSSVKAMENRAYDMDSSAEDRMRNNMIIKWLDGVIAPSSSNMRSLDEA